MQKILYFLFFVLYYNNLEAQFNITGLIRSEKGSLVLQEIVISVDHDSIGYLSDRSGHFRIAGQKAGTHMLNFSHVSFEKKQLLINLQSDTFLLIDLSPAILITNEVIISALRATPTTPIAFTNISKTELEKTNFGQDMPYLLHLLPSVVSTSDAGNGVGYTGIRIRGSDASRINVTINGIPLNDAESQNVYWVNLPDLSSSTENIQIQRGVGSSSNGAGAFGGSISVQTTKINALPHIESSFSAGAFNTFKNTLSINQKQKPKNRSIMQKRNAAIAF